LKIDSTISKDYILEINVTNENEKKKKEKTKHIA